MSVSSSVQLVSPPSGAKEITLVPNASPDNAIVGAACKILAIEIDNTNNGSQSVYVKLFDAASVTAGTTAPDEVFYCRGGKRRFINFFADDRLEFNTALSACCVTTGGTGGTTSPTSNVNVKMTVTS